MKIQSKVPVGIKQTLLTKNLEFCNIVYMCIKEKGTYDYEIPENLESFLNPLIKHCYLFSNDVLKNVYDMNCYVTVKKMYVQPNMTGNREGWHIDGFLGDQHDFIWSDCPATPTEVAVGTFDLTPDHEQSIIEMYEQNNGCFNYQLEPDCLYYLDDQCVHRPTVNKTNNTVLRTFVKITFTRDDFNAIGNAWNYKLPHIKPNKQRSECRNHGVL